MATFFFRAVAADGIRNGSFPVYSALSASSALSQPFLVFLSASPRLCGEKQLEAR